MYGDCVLSSFVALHSWFGSNVSSLKEMWVWKDVSPLYLLKSWLWATIYLTFWLRSHIWQLTTKVLKGRYSGRVLFDKYNKTCFEAKVSGCSNKSRSPYIHTYYQCVIVTLSNLLCPWPSFKFQFFTLPITFCYPIISNNYRVFTSHMCFSLSQLCNVIADKGSRAKSPTPLMLLLILYQMLDDKEEPFNHWKCAEIAMTWWYL